MVGYRKTANDDKLATPTLRSVNNPKYTRPLGQSEMQINVSEKVSTMGSCFAQNISRTIKASGFNYFIAEQKPSKMTSEEGVDANYEVFSARYRNVYITR